MIGNDHREQRVAEALAKLDADPPLEVDAESYNAVERYSALMRYTPRVLELIGRRAAVGERTALQAFVRILTHLDELALQMVQAGVESPAQLRAVVQRMRELERMDEHQVAERCVGYLAEYLTQHPDRRAAITERLDAGRAQDAGADEVDG